MPETRRKKASKNGPTTKQLKLEETGCQKNINNKIVNSEKDTGSVSTEQNAISDTNMMECINQKHEDHPEQSNLTQLLEAKMDLILTRIDKVEENIESKFSSLVTRVTQLESSVQGN